MVRTLGGDARYLVGNRLQATGSDRSRIQIEEHEAPLLNVYAQLCAMVQTVIYVARHGANGVAFAGMLRRFKVTVAVVP